MLAHAHHHGKAIFKNNNMPPTLRCRLTSLPKLAARYSYGIDDGDLHKAKSAIQKRGHMTLAELRDLAQWKSPRSAGKIESNSAAYVKEITGLALAAKTEQARIELLTLLKGVGWPTASVILHFYHKSPYPIIDFRALWTLSLEVPNQYDFELWMAYVQACRELSKKSGLNMRELDRALWQYSAENQES